MADDSLLAALDHISEQLTQLDTIGERAPSRFLGQGADPIYARQVASQRRAPQRLVHERGSTCQLGQGFLADLRAWSRGDGGAFQRLARDAKSITGGELLIAPQTLPGYLPAVHAAAPMRFLATQHEVTGREVRAASPARTPATSASATRSRYASTAR